MSTAGYSGTPLPKKLGIEEGHRVALLRAPAGFERTLGSLPAVAQMQRDPRGAGPFDVQVLFSDGARDLVPRFARAQQRMVPDGALWVAWPKKASGVATDLDENVVRAIGLAAGLVDVKVCAIDATWSGLKFVVRLKDR